MFNIARIIAGLVILLAIAGAFGRAIDARTDGPASPPPRMS